MRKVDIDTAVKVADVATHSESPGVCVEHEDSADDAALLGGELSLHAGRRAARRNVGVSEVEYVLLYGRMVQRTGVTFYFLGRRDIPPHDLRKSWVCRLEGTVALVAADGQVITVYRNRRALPAIRRKAKHRLPLPPMPQTKVS